MGCLKKLGELVEDIYYSFFGGVGGGFGIKLGENRLVGYFLCLLKPR
ncbi:hypothetical protein [Methanonatronarchaeum sp. AMET-Sl]|nr:hypothetical protein [Methanonatronarchaeum sp. AMET-Sl]WGI17190.1 hypothetical protein QEN48_06725 [Methanonatronarchaeum sp. AMET-Sl]